MPKWNWQRENGKLYENSNEKDIEIRDLECGKNLQRLEATKHIKKVLVCNNREKQKQRRPRQTLLINLIKVSYQGTQNSWHTMKLIDFASTVLSSIYSFQCMSASEPGIH